MKLFYPLTSFLFATISFLIPSVKSSTDGECTIGTLFMSTWNTTTILGLDLDGANYDSLEVTYEIDTGMKEQWLQDTHNGAIFASMYRGNVASRYLDGKVKFITSGVKIEEHDDHYHLLKGKPKELKRDGFDCARPIHYTMHDGKIAIFCDGYYPVPYNPSLQVNSTVWLIDESKYGQGAQVWSTTLKGSHHGVAIPVDEGHVFHSVATPERENGNSTNSLPNGFVVINEDGKLVKSLNDNSTKSTHCSGFHGSGMYNNTLALACDSIHGGFLVVDYNEKLESYTSRPYMYPANMPHRSGTIVDHKMHSMVIANFAATNQTSHLFMFNLKKGRRSIREQNILTLDFITGSQCAFDFEKGFGTKVFVWLPNGKLRTYSTSPMWELINEVEVLPGMTACSQASFLAGYNAAFVMLLSSPTLYTIDLSDFSVHATSLPYTPYSAIVSGVPTGTACKECVLKGKACKTDNDCCPGMMCFRSFPGPKRCHANK